MTKPEVRRFITTLLDEFIPLFDAPYFHIGGDEWQYDNQKLACEELVTYAESLGFDEPGDVFVSWINEINTQVKSYGKTTQIWNWWRFSPNDELQNRTTIQPDKDIVINVWNQSRKEQILEDGYQVIISPEVGEGALYISPGFNGTNPGDYGYFDNKYNYEQWNPALNSQIQGYKICMWSDRVEDKPDSWFDQFAERPKAIFAEKTWGTKSASKIEDFIIILETIGLSPAVK
jgi:hexosaminidase